MDTKCTAEGQCIAVLTSGGDSQGMNAAIRAVVRMAISLKAKVFGVKWGYQGLIDGGENIFELTWNCVDNIISSGGTFIGSARCQQFRTADGRKKAALNLVERNINGLVVIGGDGSLTGADMFRREWPSYIDQFVQEGKLPKENSFKHFSVTGIVGSIDNDFCGTDMTIGADSALHRITECVQSISTTAQSHQRAFVLEVMGRNSGYLALISGISCSADYVFIPEWPAGENWRQEIVKRLNAGRKLGKNFAIVIVAEGACDRKGVPITCNQVKDVISEQVGFDTRSTILGHVQRGGTPSAFDRVLATRFGVEAVIALFQSAQQNITLVMCLENGKIVAKPLMKCVEKLQLIKKAYDEHRYDDVALLRGPTFQLNVKMFKLLRQTQPKIVESITCQKNIAIVCVGAVAPATMSICRALTRVAISLGYCSLAFKGGIPGIVNENFVKLTWNDVEDWNNTAGNLIGTSRTSPDGHYKQIADVFKKMDIKALIVVGGFDAMVAVKLLSKYSQQHPDFFIPTVHIPATMSNNVPTTYISIGCDSTLNVACQTIDKLIQSGRGYNNRVYVVETMGKKCGYLAVMSALATGGHKVYIQEEKFGIRDLVEHVDALRTSFEKRECDFSLILMSDEANPTYNKDLVSKLINQEIPGIHSVPMALGYIQQGILSSPFDRFTSAKIGFKTVNYIHQLLTEKNGDSNSHHKMFTMYVFQKGKPEFRSIEEVSKEANFANRTPLTASNFMPYKELANLLTGLKFNYRSEAFPDLVFENSC